jgi:hypothetical protein
LICVNQPESGRIAVLEEGPGGGSASNAQPWLEPRAAQSNAPSFDGIAEMNDDSIDKNRSLAGARP